MNRSLFDSAISYTIIASIFITGAGIETSFFKFYWYYPFYCLFIFFGFFAFRKMDYKPLLVIGLIILYAIITFETGLALVVKQIINIGFSFTVFYFLLSHEKHDLIRLFEKYVRVAKLLVLLGFFQVILFSIGQGKIFTSFFPWLKSYHVSLRLQSLSQEPSYIAFTFAPIVLIALHNLLYHTRYFLSRKWSYAFVLSYLLTQSTIAYMGFLLMLLLLYFKDFNILKLRLFIFAMGGVALLAYLTYLNVPGVKFRIDDTVSGISSDFFDDNTFLRVNPSTYAILSNYYVTSNAVSRNPVFGHGLGTYEIVYDREISPKVYDYALDYILLNRQDAASMAMRLIVEFGTFGAVILIYFILHFRIKSGDYISHETALLGILNFGILILIILALMRNGNYTVHGKLLFVMMYYYSYKQYRYKVKTLESHI